MKLDELAAKMRAYELASEDRFLPGLHVVARLDGRAFTRLTKELHPFEKPFDSRFHDMMKQTVEHLMTCGFSVRYGYTQSDEVSLLLENAESMFQRRTLKLATTLAGEASAKFSLALGSAASFDCRLSLLPHKEDVVDYFRWRSEDAHRNALNSHCYWMLRNQGKPAGEADRGLLRLSTQAKNELLFSSGVNFNELPVWQRRGSGAVWETYERSGTDPRTGSAVTAERRRIAWIETLPMKDAYSRFVSELL